MTRDALRSAAAAEVDRWEGLVADELTRLFDRHQAVVLARLTGTKARKHTRHWEPVGERKLDPAYVVDAARWVKSAAGALGPLVRRMYVAVYTRVGGALGAGGGDPDGESLDAAIDARLEQITVGVETAVGEVEAFIAAEDDAGTAMPDIAAGVRDLYSQRTSTWVQRISTLSAVGTINHAAMSAAFNAGSVSKQWVSRHDERVRDTHDHVDGTVRPILARFTLGGIATHPAKSQLLFPGDPTGPLDEVINCRCTLVFSPVPAGSRGSSSSGSGAGRAAAALGLVAAGAAVGAVGAAAGAGGAAGATGAVAGGTAAVAASQAGDDEQAQQQKALPKTETCSEKGCTQQATKRVIWAEGMAYQPCCDAHLSATKHRLEVGQKYGPVDGVRDIKAAKCSCCGGSGEHRDGHECYVCDASGDPLEQDGAFCGGHHGTPPDAGDATDRGEGFVHKNLEVKDRVRSAAGVRQYGQPIGSVIRRDPLLPAFSAAHGGTTASTGPSHSGSTSGRSIGRIGGSDLELGGNNGDVYKLAARYDPAGVAPDPATTQTITLRDHKGRIGAYVIWQTADGAHPKGTIVAVSVHPKLQGQKIGDQLVQAAAKVDADVKATTRPAAVAPASPTSRSVVNAPGRAASVATAPRVKDRTTGSDQAGTSGDFDADAARIDRLQKAYLRDHADTQSLFSRQGRWTRDREKQQQAIIDHFLNQPGVKSDHQILILGGLPGAGKTTTINSPAGQAALGINLDEYVTVNADEVKAEMVARGMVPDYPGLSPDEAATLYHAESFEIAHSLMRQAAKRNLNFAYDTSLKSTGQVGFATGAGAKTAPPPWRTTMLFVDVPVSVAKQRARDRYLAGGRYMPLGLIDKMRGRSRSKSGPAENFDTVKRSADRWVVIDNSGAAPVVVDQGGRRGSRPRPAAAAPTPPPPAPAPAPAAAAAAAPARAAVASVAPAAAAPNPNLPPPPAGAQVYVHPQGKVIYVLPDGSMVTYKPDGKRATSSATPAKLAAGYGGWTRLDNSAGPVGPPAAAPASSSSNSSSSSGLVPQPATPPTETRGAPAPAHARPVAPMDFAEAPLSDVPKYVADPDYVFQQKVDGIRGVLVVEAGKPPWFANKKGERLTSSTAAKITTPILAKMPPTPAGSPGYRVEGELLNGKWHVFDMVTDGGEQVPYEQRKQMADAWVGAVSGALPQVSALPTARTAKEKQDLWDRVLASGAEGVMMKRRDSPYNGGARVSHSVKAKVTATADVVVLARNLQGHDNAQIGLLVGGKVTPIGTVSTGGKDKALGQITPGEIVEVEYLWATPGNTLAQPRILRKRPDKTITEVTDASQLRLVDKTVLALAAKAMRLRLERKVLTGGAAHAVGA